MKTKYVRVNKCERCGNKAGHFIWTSSAQVNAGVYSMYPKGKICLFCHRELQAVYPDIKPRFKVEKCPICRGNVVNSVRGVGNLQCDEKYCEDCGLAVK